MDKTGWGSHTPHPTRGDAWYDPKRIINDQNSIPKLLDSQIARLRVQYQGKTRAIKTATQLASYCRDAQPRRLIPCFEVKSSGHFLSEKWWEEYFLAKVPRDAQPIIMALPTGANNFGIRKLAAAHAVGLPTMLLWREDCRPYMRGWENHVDLVKSRPGRGIYAVWRSSGSRSGCPCSRAYSPSQHACIWPGTPSPERSGAPPDLQLCRPLLI